MRAEGNCGTGDRDPIIEPRSALRGAERVNAIAWHHGHARCGSCHRPLPHTDAEQRACPSRPEPRDEAK